MGPKPKHADPELADLENDVKGDKPKAFTIKYRRPRGSRACAVCRSRKVRCDAEIHIPCTNCITFGCECVLPEVKKRGNSIGDPKQKRRQTEVANSLVNNGNGIRAINAEPVSKTIEPEVPSGLNEPILNISQVKVPPSLTSNYKTRPSIHKGSNVADKPSLTFLGSLSLGYIAQKMGENHVRLTEDIFENSDASIDSVELEILKLRGVFLLPGMELAMDLINSYFEHVHPLMPVINRTEFMRKFEDPNDSPSLMLLQSVLLCGCRISKNPLLLDSKGSNHLATTTFFRRAKALYETNYESDTVSLVQSLILMGSYWDGPEDVTRNSFYWTKVAVALAQGFGLHRDVSGSTDLTTVEKKIWRRIWWCLFEKDRNVAIAFGRPLSIDLTDCDVPMLTLEDFNEDEPETGKMSPYAVNKVHALYFIHLVKLAEVTGIIIKNQYTVRSELTRPESNFSIIKHCDMLMGIWLNNLPPQLTFSLSNPSQQTFYVCLLNAQYYNRLYLIHRSNLLKMAGSNSTNPNNYKYPSWGISFQSARMISIISKILLDTDQIKYTPVMFVYILFSALIMLVYHVDLANNLISSTASDSLFVSRAVMKELADYYPIAGVLYRYFDKHANDKLKRTRLIEHNSKMEGYNQRKAESHQKSSNMYKESPTGGSSDYSSGNIISPSTLQASSGISPRGHVHEDPVMGTGLSNGDKGPYLNLEDLVLKMKSQPDNSKASVNHSPVSSGSFPEVKLVTENMPKQNFFENFEPAQLFPNASAALTRPQTPSKAEVKPNDIMIGANIYGSKNESAPVNGNSNLEATNFFDSAFLGMNLQSGFDVNPFNDETDIY